MRYNQKNQYPLLRFSVYIMGLVMILGVSTITYTIYKRNMSEIGKENCVAARELRIVIPGVIRQVMPIDKNTAMITTAGENGVATTFIYDHCSGEVLRQFTITAVPENIGE